MSSNGRMLEKFMKAIENIKAYKCSIKDTSILAKFTSLTEINISDNK